mmetsp:Transcript_17207/g.41919  ORF Transcript_17207/g.41919 Transcript_17207/m.41919 type:complete len:541 (-) Transcript_17207:1967-3589(-)
MLNSFLSKASRGTNGSNKKEDSVAASNSSTLNTNQVTDGVAGTYPAPGSSPYFSEDGDDAPVLVVRCPSASPFPHVRLVDGSLTYDNVKTPPATTAHDGKAKKVEGTTEDCHHTLHFVQEEEGKAEDKAADAKPSADAATSAPITNEDDLLPEEEKDPMSLSLLASDVDMSAIKDLTLTTPSNTNQAIEDLVEKIDDGAVNVDKGSSDMKEKKAVDSTTSPKSEQSAVQFENKETRLSSIAKKMERMYKLPTRPALLLSVLLGASLLFYGARYALHDVTPTPASMANGLTESTIESVTLEHDLVNDTAIIKKDESATASNATQANAIAEQEVLPALNASGSAEESTAAEKMNLQDTSAGISVFVARDSSPFIIKPEIIMDPNQGSSSDFPSLNAHGDNSSCGAFQWGMGMTMPQLAIAAMFLFASTFIFGSKRTKIDHPKTESVKDESRISPRAKKELESFDLSKYFGEHTVAQLREMLRARKCKTVGKKHILVERLASVYKAELETLTVVQLRKILKSKNFTQYGSKAEIIRVLVEECP